MKYEVIIGMNVWESDSRDSKRHLKNHGGNECTVVDKKGYIVSQAERGCDGKIYNVGVLSKQDQDYYHIRRSK